MSHLEVPDYNAAFRDLFNAMGVAGNRTSTLVVSDHIAKLREYLLVEHDPKDLPEHISLTRYGQGLPVLRYISQGDASHAAQYLIGAHFMGYSHQRGHAYTMHPVRSPEGVVVWVVEGNWRPNQGGEFIFNLRGFGGEFEPLTMAAAIHLVLRAMQDRTYFVKVGDERAEKNAIETIVEPYIKHRLAWFQKTLGGIFEGMCDTIGWHPIDGTIFRFDYGPYNERISLEDAKADLTKVTKLYEKLFRHASDLEVFLRADSVLSDADSTFADFEDTWKSPESLPRPIASLSDFVGLTLTDVRQEGDCTIVFELEDGRTYRLKPEFSCCESVDLNSIEGELSTLVGHPILVAEVTRQEGNYTDAECDDRTDNHCHWTWSFTRLATIKGWVIIRWDGSSNGCYSEEPKLRQLDDAGHAINEYQD